MSLGVWVLVGAGVVAAVLGTLWTITNGVFRGTRRVRGVGVRGSAGLVTGVERPARPAQAGGGSARPGRPAEATSVLAGTAYDRRRGDRATLVQFSSAFCAPCRVTRRTLAQVAEAVPGVTHVEVDAEHHLDLVRDLGVVRTPTTLVLDADGRELTRATGAPRSDQVLAALGARLR